MIVGQRNSDHASRRGAFSLAETVMATFLVAGLCVVALDTVGTARSSEAQVADRSRASLLAQELMSEVLLLDYQDPDMATTTLGLDAGESGGTRLDWDDVDDYDGWSASPPESRDGTEYVQYANCGRTVSVNWVKPSDLRMKVGSESKIKVITVTVACGGLPLAVLTGVKSIGLPLPNPLPGVLLVVGNTASPGANESARQTLIESWGFAVNLIAASAPSGEFQTATAGAVAAYVSTDVSSTILGTKLRSATIGVVNEHADLMDEFGFCSNVATDSSAVVVIVDNTHYITSPFVAWLQTTIYTSSQPVWLLNGKIAPDPIFLGGLPQGPLTVLSFSALDTGSLGHDDMVVAGRRVALPWGRTGFDFTALNADGQTLMRRSIEWAAGLDTP